MRLAVTFLAAAGTVPSAYMLMLLVAAATSRRDPPAPGAPHRSAVVMPAHDEEAGIAAAVASVRNAGATPIVIADNCSDATAYRARSAGATVWERGDDEKRGKGHALAWAFERALTDLPDVDSLVVVDADCEVSPNLLEALGARLAGGARAVQSPYVVANPEASPASAARYAGFALINHVRPLGKSALGLSCGLLGSGMAFETALLRELPWSAFGVTEDTGYHLRLVAAGVKVEFVPEAQVSSPMPTTLDAAAKQRARWESGDVTLARDAAMPLLVSGLRARDVQRLHAGFELLMPPQSLLMALNAGTAAAAAVLGAPRAARLSLAALAAQIAFVVGGLALVRAPAPVYRSLALAPVLALRNAALYARLARGRRQREWVRTARD